MHMMIQLIREVRKIADHPTPEEMQERLRRRAMSER